LRPTQTRMLGGLVSLAVVVGCGAMASGADKAASKAKDKDAAAAPAAGLQTGPATIAPHWSKYKYPGSVAEGLSYHIIEKGDTLWDLSRTYLKNPYLWPQVWDKNHYITDAHWIYPGDPIVFTQLSVVTDQAGGAGGTTGAGGAAGAGGAEGDETADSGGAGAGAGGAAGHRGTDLYPVTEEQTLQCSGRIVKGSEDDNLRVIGSEEGHFKVAFTNGDILYLNKGSNAGVKVGDVYSVHHVDHKVLHPANGKTLGTKVQTDGWVRVLLVSEKTATTVVETTCNEILVDDYLRPIEKVRVPLVARREPATRLTTPSGKATGYVVDTEGNYLQSASGNLLWIDLGSQDGVAPGNILTAYRIAYPDVPTSRNVLGEMAVLSVADKVALAKVTYSRDIIEPGDHVEIR
jgi:hypothetical protein